MIGFGGIRGSILNFRIGFLSSIGGRLPCPCLPTPFRILRNPKPACTGQKAGPGTEWPASRHRIASVFASRGRIAEDFRSETRVARIFASHRIATSVFSTRRHSHRIAARIVRYSENSRGLWLFPGSVRGFSRKTPGKSRENCWKNFPETRNAANSRISGHRERQTCWEPWVDTAWTLSTPSARGVF